LRSMYAWLAVLRWCRWGKS